MSLPEFLINGYKDWKENTYPKKKELLDILLKEGQKPKAMIITCCDSRVNITKIFNGEIGDFFVYRNIANLIPSFNLKDSNDGVQPAIEYGIENLKIKDLIILGHSNCGGIKHAYQLLSGQIKNNNKKIDRWVENIKPSFIKLEKNQNNEKNIKSLEKLSIINSISNLLTSVEINKLVTDRKLKIHGIWFDLKTGNLEYYNQSQNKFKNLT